DGVRLAPQQVKLLAADEPVLVPDPQPQLAAVGPLDHVEHRLDRFLAHLDRGDPLAADQRDARLAGFVQQGRQGGPDPGEVDDITWRAGGKGSREAGEDRELLEVVRLVVLQVVGGRPRDAGPDPVVAGTLTHRPQPEVITRAGMRAPTWTRGEGMK